MPAGPPYLKMILVLEHHPLEGPGLIKSYFENHLLRIKEVRLYQNEPLPLNLDGVQAVIVMGGPMNADDDAGFPFLKAEKDFLNALVDMDIPVLGICLGAQLLARARGAAVMAGAAREIGWHPVMLTPEGQKDPLFENLGREKIDVFQWHEDRFEVPDDGILMAKSPAGPQAVRIGRNAYGLQFHFEVTPGMVGTWVEEARKNGGGSGDYEKILEETESRRKIYHIQAHQLLENFYKIMIKRSLVRIK